MNNQELNLQSLKRDIEETREKLTVLIGQDTLDITEEVLDISRKLDILIVDYYCILVKGECSTDFRK